MEFETKCSNSSGLCDKSPGRTGRMESEGWKVRLNLRNNPIWTVKIGEFEVSRAWKRSGRDDHNGKGMDRGKARAKGQDSGPSEGHQRQEERQGQGQGGTDRGRTQYIEGKAIPLSWQVGGTMQGHDQRGANGHQTTTGRDSATKRERQERPRGGGSIPEKRGGRGF